MLTRITLSQTDTKHLIDAFNSVIEIHERSVGATSPHQFDTEASDVRRINKIQELRAAIERALGKPGQVGGVVHLDLGLDDLMNLRGSLYIIRRVSIMAAAALEAKIHAAVAELSQKMHAGAGG